MCFVESLTMNTPLSDNSTPRPAERREHLAGNSLNPRGIDVNEYVEFLKAFLRRPGAVGAICPSSRSLAEEMVRGLSLDAADSVVEIGAGSGSFTEIILEKIGEKTTFVALELDANQVRNLRHRFPSALIYHDSAERMVECLAPHGKSRAQYIISGLPWASLEAAVQKLIMEALLKCLATDGVFTTFAYVHACKLPKARRFRSTLERHFGRVEVSPVVWKNIPPAFVYRCSKPKGNSSSEVGA